MKVVLFVFGVVLVVLVVLLLVLIVVLLLVLLVVLVLILLVHILLLYSFNQHAVFILTSISQSITLLLEVISLSAVTQSLGPLSH